MRWGGMVIRYPTVMPLMALALVAACHRAPPPDPVVAEGSSAPGDVTPLPTAPSAPPAAPDNGQPAPPRSSVIPAAMQGRWGLVAEDCTPGRSDAKGLLTVEPTQLRFYESVGRLALPQTVTDHRFIGRFTFSGEGMTWEKVQTLDLDGASLTRTDMDGTYHYQRCA